MEDSLPKKMIHNKFGNELIFMFDHLSQCLEDWSIVFPSVSQKDLNNEWKNEMEQYITSISEDDTLVESIYAGLVNAYNEWDSDDYTEPVDHNQTYSLMQRPQTTQRTLDWYTEFKRCLTASEFYKIVCPPRERGILVLQKSGKLELNGRSSNTAVLRCNMSAFDWGICFEPVVKLILESTWESTIHDVGRFVHLTNTKLAASPDGLIIKSVKHPEMGGHLLEIKCPKSRTIGLKVPIEYFYQMQLQLEVTGVRACEYVEAKFDFKEENFVKPLSGWYGKIAVIGYFNEKAYEWLPCKYIYGPLADLDWKPDLGLNENILEMNQWVCEKIHHERVYRDEVWFSKLIPKIDEFWSDVEKSKNGEFVLAESSRKKKEVLCLIKDDSESETSNKELNVLQE
jgi:hypothetical protein